MIYTSLFQFEPFYSDKAYIIILKEPPMFYIWWFFFRLSIVVHIYRYTSNIINWLLIKNYLKYLAVLNIFCIFV